MLSQQEKGRSRVRCADCRFLRVQERNSLLAPDSTYRISGGSITGPIGKPVCMKAQCPLAEEFEGASGTFNERVVEVLWKARECPDYQLAEEVALG